MVRTQVHLRSAERAALARLARAWRRPRSRLIREAIDAYLREGLSQRRGISSSGRGGLWRGRRYLPDFARLRREWDGEGG